MDIPVHEPCARKRLLAANKNVESLKKSPILVTNFITVPVFLGAPNWLTDFLGTNWMTSMVISNFPGPNFPGLAFYGAQYIDDVVTWVPHMRGSAGTRQSKQVFFYSQDEKVSQHSYFCFRFGSHVSIIQWRGPSYSFC